MYKLSQFDTINTIISFDRGIGIEGNNSGNGGTGPTGPSMGPIGPAGATGSTGPTGIQGRPGIGFGGATGPTGVAGNAVNTGAMGPTGSGSIVTGPTGPTGTPSVVTGPTGSPSTVTGPTGQSGPTGSDSVVTGPTGPPSIVTGPTGQTGPTGNASVVTGPTGQTGQSNPNASFITITDTNVTGTYYPTFVSGTGTGQTLYVDATTTPFTYNPSIGALSSRIVAQGVGANRPVNGQTVALTSADPPNQIFTSGGGGNATLNLPNATTIPVGTKYCITNTSTFSVIIQNSSGISTLYTIPPNGSCDFLLIDATTVNGSWSQIPNLSYTASSGTDLTIAGNMNFNNAGTATITNTAGGRLEIRPTSIRDVNNSAGVTGSILTSQGAVISPIWRSKFSGANIRFSASSLNGNQLINNIVATVVTISYDTGFNGTLYNLAGTKYFTIPVSGYYNVGGQILVQNVAAATVNTVRFVSPFNQANQTGYPFGSTEDITNGGVNQSTYSVTAFYNAGTTFGLYVGTVAPNWQINNPYTYMYITKLD